MSRGEALHLDDIAALAFQRSSEVIKSGLRVLAEDSLSGAEADLSLIRGLVLIDIADHLLDRSQAGVGLGRGLLRGLGLVAGVNSMLVGFVRLGGSEADTFLGTRIRILNHFAIGRGEFIKLVDPVT